MYQMEKSGSGSSNDAAFSRLFLRDRPERNCCITIAMAVLIQQFESLQSFLGDCSWEEGRVVFLETVVENRKIW